MLVFETEHAPAGIGPGLQDPRPQTEEHNFGAAGVAVSQGTHAFLFGSGTGFLVALEIVVICATVAQPRHEEG